MTNTEMLKAWVVAKQALQTAKRNELDLRNTILRDVLDGKSKGSRTTFYGGAKVTGTAKLNRIINEVEYRLTEDLLTDEEQACFKWKPTVVEGKFNKLDLGEHPNLVNIVTEKPGQGQLEIKDDG